MAESDTTDQLNGTEQYIVSNSKCFRVCSLVTILKCRYSCYSRLRDGAVEAHGLGDPPKVVQTLSRGIGNSGFILISTASQFLSRSSIFKF